MRQNKRRIRAFLVIGMIFFAPAPAVWADTNEDINYLSRGFFRILTAAFEFPRHLLYKTVNEPIVFGTIDGALSGTYYTVAELSGGAFDLLRGAAPYAKYLVFFA